MDDLKEVCQRVNDTFVKAFGNSSLDEGKSDLLRQATEFSRAGTYKDMEYELGHILASALQRANELKLDPLILVGNALSTIMSRSKQYSSLGRRVNVVILGGAFDPITVGHIQNAKHILDSTNGDIDEVWIMPCFSHLFGKKMASPEHRLEMCRLAVKNDKRIKISDYEISKQFAGDTYYMVKNLLQEEFAKHQYNFSIAIGQDNANTFDQWSNHKYLEQAIRFVVCPRPGCVFDHSKAWYLKAPHIYLSPSNKLIEISSTQVRDAASKGAIDTMESSVLEDEVRLYIKENHLYGS